MRVPDHAAISSSVELARARIGPGPVGLVNAVLRKVAAHDLDGVDPAGRAGPRDRPVRLRRHRALPPPLGGRGAGRRAGVRGAAGGPARRRQRATARHARRPARARPPSTELVAAGGTASTLSPYAVELAGGDPAAIPAVAEGRAGVQDEGSQLVALALAGRRDRRARRAVARRLCRARRQGRAARGAGRPARRPAAGQRAPAPPRPARRPRLAGRRGGAARRGHRRRHPAAVARRDLRPGARRRPLLRARGPAPPAGVALAPHASRTSRRWSRSSERCWTGRWTPSVRGAWWSTPPARPSWRRPRRWSTRWSAPGTTRAVVATRQLWPHRDGTDAMFIATFRS